jgi:pilus assembly protein Flp/PilA
MSAIRRFLFDQDEAATAVEYAVLLALILVLVISAVKSFGSANGGLWSNNVTQMQNAGI